MYVLLNTVPLIQKSQFFPLECASFMKCLVFCKLCAYFVCFVRWNCLSTSSQVATDDHFQIENLQINIYQMAQTILFAFFFCKKNKTKNAMVSKMTSLSLSFLFRKIKHKCIRKIKYAYCSSFDTIKMYQIKINDKFYFGERTHFLISITPSFCWRWWFCADNS